MAKDDWCRTCGGAGYVDDSQFPISGGRTERCPTCRGAGRRFDLGADLHDLVVCVVFGAVVWALAFLDKACR